LIGKKRLTVRVLRLSVIAKPDKKTLMRMRAGVPDRRALGLMIADEDFGGGVGALLSSRASAAVQ
jgi:hypothetical protein